jgi:hypothetical protein
MQPDPTSPPAESAPAVDPALAAIALERLRARQDLAAGLLAGLVAAAVGAGLWAALTLLTGARSAWIALGIGLLVGYAVRVAGRGLDLVFSFGAAALALVGCLVGNLLAACGAIARRRGVPFGEVLDALDPETAIELMRASFDAADLVFYAVGAVQAFKLARRPLTPADLAAPPELG